MNSEIDKKIEYNNNVIGLLNTEILNREHQVNSFTLSLNHLNREKNKVREINKQFIMSLIASSILSIIIVFSAISLVLLGNIVVPLITLICSISNIYFIKRSLDLDKKKKLYNLDEINKKINEIKNKKEEVYDWFNKNKNNIHSVISNLKEENKYLMESKKSHDDMVMKQTLKEEIENDYSKDNNSYQKVYQKNIK